MATTKQTASKPPAAGKVSLADRKVVDIATLTLMPIKRGGGGREASELVVKVSELKNGQAFRITESEYGKADGEVHKFGGWGLSSAFNYARRHRISMKSRLDANGHRWLFRDTVAVEKVVNARRDAKDALKSGKPHTEASEPENLDEL